ncbi:hypothetical protein EDEG_01588 [Edhazardia aedis USNM 41457]|uniref:Uncharacterized protein n=1 Tax=Edhazardia aedis (strain USNM 41457) TaxID=1003232 RepID=J8ZWS3_EDHAE|nr:hypothetical protein EDEG_01588 [Edhazardia aedis USNM 41457]|eukprot:EJW04108.1 hypothetical protein EDEG_01588 [Edhazardia aedis USNM 41457]
MKLLLLIFFLITILRISVGMLPVFFDEIVPGNSLEESRDTTDYQNTLRACDSENIVNKDSLFFQSKKILLGYEKSKIADDQNVALNKKLEKISNALKTKMSKLSRILKSGTAEKNQLPESTIGKNFFMKVFTLFGDERELLKKTSQSFFIERRNYNKEEDEKSIAFLNGLYDDWIYNLQRTITLYKNVKVNILSDNYYEFTNNTLNLMYEFYKSNNISTEIIQNFKSNNEDVYTLIFFEIFRDDFIKFDNDIHNAIFYDLKYFVNHSLYEFLPLYCEDVNSEKRCERIVARIEDEMRIQFEDLRKTTLENAKRSLKVITSNQIMRELLKNFDDADNSKQTKNFSSCSIM